MFEQYFEWDDEEEKEDNWKLTTILSLSAYPRTYLYPSSKSYTSRVILKLFSLKLGNIMLSHNMDVKIGDFGLAAKL